MFKALNTDDGVIAVDPEWAAARGLPPSTERFPWDTEKRVYVVNGYHGIHCIVSSCLNPRIIFLPRSRKPGTASPLAPGVSWRPPSKPCFWAQQSLSRLAAQRHYVSRRRHATLHRQYQTLYQRNWPDASMPRLGKAGKMGQDASRVFSLWQFCCRREEGRSGGPVQVLSGWLALFASSEELLWEGRGLVPITSALWECRIITSGTFKCCLLENLWPSHNANSVRIIITLTFCVAYIIYCIEVGHFRTYFRNS